MRCVWNNWSTVEHIAGEEEFVVYRFKSDLEFLCVLSRPLRTQQVQQKIRMYNWQYMQLHIDVLVQKRRNSSVLAMELDLPFTNPSIYLLSHSDEALAVSKRMNT